MTAPPLASQRTDQSGFVATEPRRRHGALARAAAGPRRQRPRRRCLIDLVPPRDQRGDRIRPSLPRCERRRSTDASPSTRCWPSFRPPARAARSSLARRSTRPRSRPCSRRPRSPLAMRSPSRRETPILPSAAAGAASSGGGAIRVGGDGHGGHRDGACASESPRFRLSIVGRERGGR